MDFRARLRERLPAAANKVGRHHSPSIRHDPHYVRREDLLRSAVLSISARGLECAGTFTHFATADARTTGDFGLQWHRFIEAWLLGIKNAGCELGLVHADNNPGTVLHKDKSSLIWFAWALACMDFIQASSPTPGIDLQVCHERARSRDARNISSCWRRR